MIKIEFKTDQPDAIVATMTMTMTVGEWKNLRAQLDMTYPAWKLSQAISSLVAHVENHFEDSLTWED